MTTMELDARKARLAREILNIDSMELLDKLQKAFNRVKAKATAMVNEEETEYISKEEILAGIDAGLKEMQERKRTGKKAKTLEDLINEL